MKIKSPYLVKPRAKFRLKDRPTDDTGGFKREQDVADELEKHCGKLGELQEVPTPLEAAHDYLWRAHAAVPRFGTIGIFNRSHYEDVLVTRVHKTITDKVAQQRFREINQFEEMLSDNNVTILKFFLHISHKEQTARLKARCEEKDKHYKISESDFHERVYWNKYQQYYEEAIDATSRKHAPWFVIPADHKWYRNIAVSRIIVDALEAMDLRYPQPTFDVSKLCDQL
jgi:PPK2 family polyphosphate:nucleotide phosphotransferase